nr:hypothetical protein [Tanacetum cinerariifolium]
MALGKDSSNPLMADNLPKIVWYSTHRVTLIKSWPVQKQTALGKDKSNPLMADNLPKIVWYSTHRVTLIKSWPVQKQTALVTTVSQEPSIPSPTPPTPPPQPPQDLPSTSQVHHTPPQSPQVQQPSAQPQTQPQPPQTADFPMSLLQEALDACATLTKRVEHLEYDKRVDTSEDTVMDDKSNQGRKIDELDKDDVVALMDDKEEDNKEEEAKAEDEPAEVQEVVDVVTTAKLITKVVTVASITISTVEPQVPATTITAAPAKVNAAPSRRRKGVVIRDPEEELTTSSIIPAEPKSKDKGKRIMLDEPRPLKKKQHVEMDEEYARKLHVELNKDIDWDVAIDHVKQKAKEDPTVQRYQVMKRKPQIEAHAQKNMIMYLKNVAGFRLDYIKGMSYDDIRLIFEVKFNSNMDFLLKTKEQMEEEKSRALQSINETPAQKAAKRRKLNEEVEDLKRNLEIVPDEDDDVYTEATPFARKVPIVDYEIINLNNKPYYKIIRADGTRQLFISFLTLLKNFDREDLEVLWNLVKKGSSLEELKEYTWSSKGQELEATGIMWCAHHNIFNHSADFVSKKKIPTLKVYTRSNVECSETSSRRRK